MRESTKILVSLSWLVSAAILSLGAWMPEARADRMWLWLVGAAIAAVLADRILDRRL